MPVGSSVVRRYLAMSLFAAIGPALLVRVPYDRYSQSLLDELIGERQSMQLTAMSKPLEAFLDARRYQLETLANHPAMFAAAQSPVDAAADAAAQEAHALLRLEPDVPDLYGILSLSRVGRLVHQVAGQAASGPPYWSEVWFDIAALPVTRTDSYDIVGPAAPIDGLSGWFLRQRLATAAHAIGAEAPEHLRVLWHRERSAVNIAAHALRAGVDTPEVPAHVRAIWAQRQGS